MMKTTTTTTSSSSSSLSKQQQQNYDRLIEWVKQGEGGYVGNVRINSTISTSSSTSNNNNNQIDTYTRGLFATADLQSNDILVRIPRTHVITARRARHELYVRSILSDTISSGLNKQLADTTSDSAALLLFLMAERCKSTDSFWYPWFQSLPEKFTTLMTVILDDEEFIQKFTSVLDGTPAFPFILQLRQELKEMYQQWFVPYALEKYPHIYHNKTLCEYKDFVYVHAILESRAFKLASVDDTILAPLADMANHAGIPSAKKARVRGWTMGNTTTTTVRESEDNDGTSVGLELVVCENQDNNNNNNNNNLKNKITVKKNEEIKISYGCLANWELLVHFAFALRENAYDDVVVQADVQDIVGESEDNDELERKACMQRMIALHVHVPDLSKGFSLSLKQPLPVNLLKAVRIAHAMDEELDNAAKRNYAKPVSMRNEQAVIQWLRLVVESLSVEEEDEDEEDDLKKKENNDKKRLLEQCKIYRDSLRHIVQRTKEEIDNLDVAISSSSLQPTA